MPSARPAKAIFHRPSSGSPRGPGSPGGGPPSDRRTGYRASPCVPRPCRCATRGSRRCRRAQPTPAWSSCAARQPRPRRPGDKELLGGRYLTASFGTALVHSDSGGMTTRARSSSPPAVDLATAAGAEQIAAKAPLRAEYVDVLAGGDSRTSAAEYLKAAGERTADDPALTAALAGFEAVNLEQLGASRGECGTVRRGRRAEPQRRRRPPARRGPLGSEHARCSFSGVWMKRSTGLAVPVS